MSKLIPETCVLCGVLVHQTDLQHLPGMCEPCRSELPYPSNGCRRCGVELGSEPPVHGYCGLCLVAPPAFDHCVALCQYEYPVRELIANFKFHARFAEGQALAYLLSERVLTFYGAAAMPGMLIPVPLHPRRLRERGYNQSVELARIVGRRCNIRVDVDYCKRIRATPPQKGLSADERASNLHDAFGLTPLLKASTHMHVAIVDDVVTTMATVNTIARLLRAAGHSRIDVICLARVS